MQFKFDASQAFRLAANGAANLALQCRLNTI